MGMDLTPMYKALSKASGQSFFDANPEMVRSDVAETARADAIQAAQQGRPDIAFLASSAASIIYLSLGDRDGSLRNRLDALQALFMIATSVPDYDSVRQQALELDGVAREISSTHTSFRSLVLAADCSWFSADAAPADQPAEARDRQLTRALGDLLVALRAAEPLVDDPDERGWVERLASILAITADAAMANRWSQDEDELDVVLRQVAGAADVLPLDLAFRDESGKASAVAVVLEQLESRYH
ncbi:hypothetical protein ACXC9Q_33240 [Kribbella sp. CWNU-51]